MQRAGQSYSSGEWLVRAGGEEEFVDRWNAFIEWTADNAAGAESSPSFEACITIPLWGRAGHLIPPPRNGGPAFFLPLFTQVRGRGVLRTSHGLSPTPVSVAVCVLLAERTQKMARIVYCA